MTDPAELAAHWDRMRTGSDGWCAEIIHDWDGPRRCSRTSGGGLTGRFCWQHDPWRHQMSPRGLINLAMADPLAVVDELLNLRYEVELTRISDAGTVEVLPNG